jgi:cytochrome c biogenesis protein CcdA/thiol-disulfide isomerase/thioredoxin
MVNKKLLAGITPLVLLIALVLLGALPLGALADDTVEMTVYFSPTCGHCTAVHEQVLDPLSAAYGDRLQITWIDVSQAENLSKLETVEQEMGQPNNPLPVIHLGEELIASEDVNAIEQTLTARLTERLGPPPQAQATPASSGPSSEPTAISNSPSDAPTIHLAYVQKDGCSECERASVVLQAIQQEYPQLVVQTFNDVRDAERVEAMGAHLGLPDAQRLLAPSVYVGNEALIGDEITTASLKALLERHASGAQPFWEDLDIAQGQRSILERFQTMGPLAVVVAALIDGINPCAFATILFFVSYLAVSRRRRSELLAVGLAFTAGVFLTYLLVGLGAMSLLRLASTVRVVGIILYSLMTLSCLVLAGISVHDYILARQGRLHDMKLNLPDPLRERIKGRIRAASGAFLGASFVSGLIVSVLELACTGQVYLPTISFVVGIPEMRASAIFYLVMYNLVFILPLLAVLVLAVYGVSAMRFQEWFVKNAARTKLIMAVLFLVLGALLISQLLTI